MKALKLSATITIILGFLSALSLTALFLALCDIAQQNEDLVLEWRIAGISIIIQSVFTISTFVTLGLLIKYLFSGKNPVVSS